MSRIGPRLLRSAVPVLVVLAALAAAVAGFAHPGGRAEDGCHFCRSNCEKWNLEKDERHCHDDDSTSRASDSAAAPTVACARGSGETWRGLVVAPECRCTPYDRDDYPYPQSVESLIAQRDGMRSPYDGTLFGSLKESDIEHVVSISEAHDSGLCAASAAVRRQFARDLDNLALATPRLNRYQKSGHDAAEWLPPLNRCWYATTIIAVRQEYRLTIDQHEANALENVLAACGVN
jgi:hypothetical protein